MYNVAFNWMFQNFAANGFVVLYTNPRGSTGYGSAFGNAIKHAYPERGLRRPDGGRGFGASGRGYIDTKSMFVSGCSRRRRALELGDRAHRPLRRGRASAARSSTGSASRARPTSRSSPTISSRSPFWEDPAPWLKQSSLMYVGNVKTPTMLMTGVLDMRTPMPQTEEYYVALRMRGVPAVLLRFENEWHGTSRRAVELDADAAVHDELVQEVREGVEVVYGSGFGIRDSGASSRWRIPNPESRRLISCRPP